jgi:hypothetical protein
MGSFSCAVINITANTTALSVFINTYTTMETIRINNSVFFIPPSQPKLQANCAKEYGQFLLDCPPKLTILEAQQGGYLKGNKADFAIAFGTAL